MRLKESKFSRWMMRGYHDYEGPKAAISSPIRLHTRHSMGKMPKMEKKAELEAEFFRTLGDESRAQILVTLIASHEPLNVSEIADRTRNHISNVSRHLSRLYQVGVVSKQRLNNQRLYAANVDALREKLQAMLSSLPPPNRSTAAGNDIE